MRKFLSVEKSVVGPRVRRTSKLGSTLILKEIRALDLGRPIWLLTLQLTQRLFQKGLPYTAGRLSQIKFLPTKRLFSATWNKQEKQNSQLSPIVSLLQAPYIHSTKHLLSEHLLCAKHCAKLEQKCTIQNTISKGNGCKL